MTTRSSKISPVKALQDALFFSGWSFDRWGNANKTVGARKFRCKFQKISVRFERKNAGIGEWINIRSDYYKNVLVEGNSVVIGGITLP